MDVISSKITAAFQTSRIKVIFVPSVALYFSPWLLSACPSKMTLSVDFVATQDISEPQPFMAKVRQMVQREFFNTTLQCGANSSILPYEHLSIKLKTDCSESWLEGCHHIAPAANYATIGGEQDVWLLAFIVSNCSTKYEGSNFASDQSSLQVSYHWTPFLHLNYRPEQDHKSWIVHFLIFHEIALSSFVNFHWHDRLVTAV